MPEVLEVAAEQLGAAAEQPLDEWAQPTANKVPVASSVVAWLAAGKLEANKRAESANLERVFFSINPPENL